MLAPFMAHFETHGLQLQNWRQDLSVNPANIKEALIEADFGYRGGLLLFDWVSGLWLI